MVYSDHMHNVGACPKNGDKLHQLNIYSSNSDKYMSYIKVSKRQHELVKGMKLSCKSTQSKSLKHVLGDLDNIHVQPYKLFIEEEQKKLHEHWLQLVNIILPAEYAKWTMRQIQKRAVVNSLVVEMKDKSKPPVKDENIVFSGVQLQDHEEDGGLNGESSLGDGVDSTARSTETQSLHNPHISNDEKLNHLNMESEKNIVFPRNLNTQKVSISEVAPFSSDDHVWQAVQLPHSYYDSAPTTHEYTANGLSLVNRQVNEAQQSRLITLESDLCQGNISKELLPRHSANGPFSSYQSQDQIDLLQSLFKGEMVNSYHLEQKRAGLDFQTSNNVMMGGGPFSSHFKQPLQTSLTLDQVQRRASVVFMPENISDNIYSDRERYLISRSNPLPAVNVTDWAVNGPPRMVAPSRPQVNNRDFIDRHWFPSDHQVRGVWNGSEDGNLSSHSLGTGVNSDQSLFSVLSACSQLSSASPYDSVRYNDQSLALRNYGIVEGGAPRTNSVVPPSSHPLSHFSGLEAPSSTMVTDNMAWMSLSNQNPALHDQMGKPYLRTWNQ
ncbi:putative nuclear factor related to kappa-B-binding protein [Lupinus albus]|uniref:Putative nuclear factor related to kappa-B-binding protein n=1 Tax=Lupinus albus TaxID=3870 RepID=A0A6A4NN62_LUPAL|nr:putative nuclear factor related to kappa-B-binding protein [Lupinus albus]